MKQTDRLLQALLRGVKITPINSYRLVGFPQPARRILDLKKPPYSRTDIQDRLIENTNQFKEVSRVKQYWIEKQQQDTAASVFGEVWE